MIGFTYVPFLGSDAPRNFPVRFSLTRAFLAGEVLPLADEAVIRQDGDRVTLDRGAVEVLYDLSLESVEQSFAVEAAGADGELRLVLRVETELTSDASHRSTDGAIRFDGSHGGVRYGAATVFDDAGGSRAVPSQLEGNELTITVPADFLRSARGPILVDPVISTYSVAPALGDQRDVDMAYDLDSDTFLYAFEQKFSGSDSDVVVMQRRATDGLFMGSAYFDLSANPFTDPSVANLNAANRSLVVAVRSFSGTGTLLGAFWDHPTGLGSTFAIDSGGFSSKSHPDVGGCGSNDPNSVFMVVWQRYWRPGSTSHLQVERTYSGTGHLALCLRGTAGWSGWILRTQRGRCHLHRRARSNGKHREVLQRGGRSGRP